MAKLKIKNPNKGIWNSWDIIKNTASTASAFKYEDYNNITESVNKQNYLLLLANNGKALSDRLPDEYNNPYITADEKVAILSGLNATLQEQTLNYDNAVNAAFAQDTNLSTKENSWAKWVAENKFEGDYNTLLSEYQKKGYQGLLEEGYFGEMPEDIFGTLSAESADATAQYLATAKQSTIATQKASTTLNYQNLLKQINANISERMRKEAYDNASAAEKTWSSVAQIAALPVTEVGNIVEGIIDVVATAIAGVAEAGGASWSQEVREFVESDIIPLDVMLMEVLPNSYATSPYTSNWNGWKIAYNVGSSMVDMLPLALNAVPGCQGLGTAIYYSSMAGRTAEEFLSNNQDLSVGTAVAYTIGSTAIEYATEHISGGDFFGTKGISDALEKFGKLNTATSFVHNVIGEGFEEVVSEIGQGILYGTLTGDYSNLNIDNIMYAGVTGGILGGLMSISTNIVMKSRVNKISTLVELESGGEVQLTDKQLVYLNKYYESAMAYQADVQAARADWADITKNFGEGIKKVGSSLTAPIRNLVSKVKLVTERGGKKITLTKDGKAFNPQTDYDTFAKTTESISKNESVDLTSVAIEDLDIIDDTAAPAEQARATTEQINAEAQLAVKNLQNAYSLYLSQLQVQWGPEAITDGVKVLNNTLERDEANFARLLQSKIDTSAKAAHAADAASKTFNTQISIVKTENDAAVRQAFKAMMSNIAAAKNMSIVTFETTKETVPSVFVINNIVYVSQSLITQQSTGNVTKLMAAQYYVYDIMKNATPDIIRLVDSFIDKNNSKLDNVSIEIQRQQVAYIMLYVEDNDIMTQLNWTSKESMNTLRNYFEKYKANSVSLPARNIINQALAVMDEAVLNSVPEEKVDAVQDKLSSRLKDDQGFMRSINRGARSSNTVWRRISYAADVNQTTADIGSAAKYFKKYLNLSFEFTNNTTWTDFAKAIQNLNNYSDKGVALQKALSAYPAVELDPRTKSINSTKSDFVSSLNYMLSDLFNIQIAPNNTFVHNYTIEETFNTDAIDKLSFADVKSNVSDGVNSRYTLKQFLSDNAISLIGSDFADFNIYFANRLENGVRGYTVAYPKVVNGKRGYIMISLANNKSDALLQNVLKHEMVHAIGDMTGFDNSMSVPISERILTNIVNNAKTDKQKASLISDITEFLATFDTEMLPDVAKQTAEEIVYEKDRTGIEHIASRLYDYLFANESNANVAQVYEVSGLTGASVVSGHSGRTYVNPNNLFIDGFLNGNSVSMVVQTRSDLGLLKRFNNQTVFAKKYSEETLKQTLAGLQAKQKTIEKAIKDTIDAKPQLRSDKEITIDINDIKSIFGGEYVDDANLQNKDFWLSRLSKNTQLKETIKSLNNEQFAELVKAYTGYQYNFVTRKFGEVSYTDRELMSIMRQEPAKNESYTGVFINQKPMYSAAIPQGIYSKYDSEVKGFVSYDANTGNTIIQLGDAVVNKSQFETLKKITSFTTSSRTRFMVGSRTFNTFKAAMTYKDTSDVKTSGVQTTQTGDIQYASFDTLFDALANTSANTNVAILQNQTDKNGKAVDTVYITNDGKVYGFGFDGNPFQAYRNICNDIQLDQSIFGKYQMNPETGEAITNDEGLTADLTRLLNAKRVVRMYLQNGEWTAYGVPNQIQDNFLKNYGIESKNTSYVADTNNVVLVTDKEGNISIVRKDINGNFEGTEVSWKTAKYYQAITQMLSRYNITSWEQLYNYGFSEEFVSKLSSYTDIKEKGTRGVGIKKGDIDAYINDGANTVTSRNMLIEAIYPNNAHLKSVADLHTYVSAVVSYAPFMKYYNDTTVYQSFLDLQDAYKAKAKTTTTEISKNLEQLGKILDNDTSQVYSRLLDMDGNPRLPYIGNCDYSLQAFNLVIGGISKGFTSSRAAAATTSLEMHAQRAKTHAGEEGTVNILDKLQSNLNNTVIDDLAGAEAEELEKLLVDLAELPAEQQAVAAQKLVDNFEEISSNLDDDTANKIFNKLFDIAEGAETLKFENQKESAATYVQSLKEELAKVPKLTGQEQIEARQRNFTSFQQLINNRKVYARKYGYSGYRAIRQAYTQYGYSAETNISSNFSKSKQRLENRIARELETGKITEQQADVIRRNTEKFDNLYQNLTTRLYYTYPGRTELLNEFYRVFKNSINGAKFVADYKAIWSKLVQAAYDGQVTLYSNGIDEELELINQAEQYKNDTEKYVEYLNNLKTDPSLNTSDYWALQARVDYLLDQVEQESPIEAKPELRRPTKATDITKTLDDAAARRDAIMSVMNQKERDAYMEDVRRSGKPQSVAARTKRANEAQRLEQTEKMQQRALNFTIERLRREREAAKQSRAVSTDEVNEVLADTFELVSNEFNYVSTYNVLRKEAKDWFKTEYPKETNRIKTLKKLLKDGIMEDSLRVKYQNELFDLQRERSQTINNYITSKIAANKNITVSEIRARSWYDLYFGNKLSSTQKKILTGLSYAYQQLVYSPQTEYSLTRFQGQVRSILEDHVLNEKIPGTNEMRRIYFNDNLIEEKYLEILKTLSDADYTNKYTADQDNRLDQFAAMLDSYKQHGLPEDLTAAKERFERGDMLVLKLKPNAAPVRGDVKFNMPEQQKWEGPVKESPIEAKPELRTSESLLGDMFEIDEDTMMEAADTLTKKEEKVLPTGERAPQTSISKTINSPLLNVKGVNVSQIYYNFEAILDETGKINSQKFIEQNANTLGKLQQSEEAASSFIEWANDNPKLLSTQQLVCTAILSNQIMSSPKLSSEVRQKASDLFKTLKSLGGRLLGVSRKTGLTPIEEMAQAALRSFNMTEAEKDVLNTAIENQKKAIADGNYTAANKAFEDALKVFEAHQDELDTNINFFKKGLTDEQKAVRLKNFTDGITNWRYFAMLSSPATFYARNMAGNYMLKAMDKTSEAIGQYTMRATEKLAEKFGQSNKLQYTIKKGKASADAEATIKSKLIDNGLIDSIMDGSVSKYDTGFGLRQGKNLKQIDLESPEVSVEDQQLLKRELNRRTPFGKSIAGQALNKYFNVIFDTMEKGDQKFVRKSIIDNTTKLVSDNMTNAEMQSLQDGTADTATKNKFNDMVEYSMQESLKVYLRSTPAAYKVLTSFLEKHPVAKTVFSIICPFPRMTMNVLMTGLSYSPVGFVMGLMTLKNDATAFRNISANTQFTKAMIGTTVSAIGAILAAIGFIKIDDDDEYAGPQLIIGDYFRVSLEDLTPATIPLIAGASLTSGTQEGGFWNGLKTSSDALLDAVIFGEFTSIFGGNKTGTDIIANTFTNFVSQFIPSVFRSAARVIDPYQKSYSGNALQKFYKKILTALPGLSTLIENKVDPYTGNYVTYYDDSNDPTMARILTIFNATVGAAKVYRTKESEIEKESVAVGATTSGPSQTYTIDGVEYTIDDKTYYKYKILRAKLYSQYASDLIKTRAYQKLPIDKKQAALKKLQSQATSNARLQLGIGV